MIKRTLAALALFVILVVAAALVAPYFVGGRAEAAFRANVAAFNARNTALHLTVARYQRGFYSSTATLEVNATTTGTEGQTRLLRLFLGSGGTPELKVRVNHGPIAIGAFTTHFSLTPVLYTADFRAENLPPLSVLGALKPEFYDTAWLTGGDRLTIDVPPGRIGLGVFGAQWQGGEAVVNMNAARDHVVNSGRVEAVKFAGMDPHTGVTINGTLEPLSWSGHSRRGPHGLWIGAGKASGQGLSISSGGETVAQVRSGRTRAETGESHDSKWYHWQSRTVQDGGSVRGWKWQSLDMDLSLNKLDAAGLGRIMKQRGSGAAGENAGLAALNRLLAAGLTAQSTGRVHLKLVAPDGTAEAAGALGIAATAAMPATIAPPLTRMHARLSLRFPRKLVLDFAARVLGPEAQQAAAQELTTLAKVGYLKSGADGRYAAVIVWGPQGATVNGLPFGAVAPPAAATGPGL